MPPSPAKRRKITSSQVRDVENPANSTRNEQPTTPTRASYLSPTKSSLARSHPHLIPSPRRRSNTEPRGKALRDELLKTKPRPPDAPQTVSTTRRSQGLSGLEDIDSAQASEGNSRLVSNESATETSATTNGTPPSGNDRPPLKERQLVGERSRGKTVLHRPPASPVIIPKLVPSKEPNSQSDTRAESGEPELPPTPVELGLSAPPEPPRGVASSSSPKHSRTSSGSRRRRSRAHDSMASSPLKPKTAARNTAPTEPDDNNLEPVQNEVEEAPESEPEEVQQADEENSVDVEEQRSTLTSLQKELEQLKVENDQLQAAIDDGHNVNEELLELLRLSAKNHGSLHDLKPSNNGDSLSAYLQLFASGNLQLTSHTKTKSINRRTKIVHMLKIEAPPPWLPNTLSCVFEVAVDAENAQVDEIEMKKVMICGTRSTKSTYIGIFRWVQDRLRHPLHQRDVGGMIWGIGRWFQVAVERAKTFRWMYVKYHKASSGNSRKKQERDLTSDDCIDLTQYLGVTQYSAVDPPDYGTDPLSPKIKKRVMLSWEINMDWTGGAVSDIQVSATGIPKEAQSRVKAIFCNLVPKLGVEGAFSEVWNLIHSDSEEFQHGNTSEKGRMKVTDEEAD